MKSIKLKNLFPYVKVYGVDEYFALPKEKREKWGIYLKPTTLLVEDLFGDTWDDLKNAPKLKGWKMFSKQIRKEYPVQGFIREWLFSISNPIYALFVIIKRRISDVYYNVKRFFKPCCPRFRKAFPRWKYIDICDATIDVNLAFILDFWYEEVVNTNHIDWWNNDVQNDFYNWLKNTVNYIEVERKNILRELENAHHIKSCDKYNEHLNKFESMLNEKDENTIIEFIKRRKFFWT